VGAGEYGLVARPADAEDFAAKLSQLLADPRATAALATRAQARGRQFAAAIAGARVRAGYEQLRRGFASTAPAR